MKILIVDDDKILAEVLTCLFENEGWKTGAELTGKNIQSRVVKDKPDVMILDYKLPEKSGLEILAELRRVYDKDSLPIMMISATNSIEGKALEAGANAFMAKPFDIATLLTRVKGIIL